MNTTQLEQQGYKQVPDFPNYWINNVGQVYSLRRKKNINPSDNGYGYLKYRLSKDGKSYSVYAHRMVYEAHVDKIPTGMVMNHINFDTKCNSLSNLECVTQRDNIQHSIKAGRKNVKGENAPNAKLRLEEVRYIRNRYAKGGTSYRVLAEQFGVTIMTISYIVRNLHWVEAA